MACENAIRSYHVDVALLSTTTIQDLALFTQDEHVLRSKQAMMEIARKKILLVDESKFHFSALNYVADLRAFDVVLVSGSVDREIVERMSDGGVKLQLV